MPQPIVQAPESLRKIRGLRLVRTEFERNSQNLGVGRGLADHSGPPSCGLLRKAAQRGQVTDSGPQGYWEACPEQSSHLSINV